MKLEFSLMLSGRGQCGGLKVSDQIPYSDTQRFGDPKQRVKANPLFATFNFADVHGVEFGLLREFFLAQASLSAALPNCITQNLKRRLGARHEGLAKQAGEKLNTPNMGLFRSCISGRMASELCPGMAGKIFAVF